MVWKGSWLGGDVINVLLAGNKHDQHWGWYSLTFSYVTGVMA